MLLVLLFKQHLQMLRCKFFFYFVRVPCSHSHLLLLIEVLLLLLPLLLPLLSKLKPFHTRSAFLA